MGGKELVDGEKVADRAASMQDGSHAEHLGVHEEGRAM